MVVDAVPVIVVADVVVVVEVVGLVLSVEVIEVVGEIFQLAVDTRIGFPGLVAAIRRSHRSANLFVSAFFRDDVDYTSRTFRVVF